MMKTNKLFILAMTAVVLAGCGGSSDFEQNPFYGSADEDLVPVEFSLSEKIDFTRAVTNIVTFNDNEDIKVFVKPANDDVYTGYVYTTSLANPNKPQQSGVNLLAPTPPPYFPTGYGTTVEAYAYYPATASDDGTAATFSVADNQCSNADYKASDLMYAANRTITKGNSAGTNLQMDHLMAQLHLNVTGTGVTVNRVLVTARRSVTFTPSAGTAVVTDDAPSDILASTTAGDAFICIPVQPINSVTVKVETGEPEDDAKTATFAFLSTDNFEAGVSYPINLTVNAEQMGTTTAISNWDWLSLTSIGDLSIEPIDDLTYDGNAKTPTVVVKKEGVVVEASNYDLTYLNNTNAGIAVVAAIGKGNYAGSVAVTTFNILKADITITTVPARINDLVYTGSAQALVTEGAITDGGTLKYKVDDGEYSADVPTAVNANLDGYSVTYFVEGDANHNSIPEVTISDIVIAKKPIATTDIVLADQNMTYTGSQLTRSVASVAGLTDASNWNVIDNTQTNAGDYTLTVTMTDGCVNYKGSATKDWSITAAESSASGAPTALSLTYNGSPQALVNAGTPSGGTMKYMVTTTNSKPASTDGFSESLPSATNYGTYYVWYYVDGDANHSSTAISNSAVTISIAQKAVTITANAQTVNYGTAISSGTGQVTVSGLISGHSVTAVNLTASTTNYPGGTITPSAATIQDAGSNAVTSNYAITYETGALTINKVNATITNAPTKKTGLTYTGSAQALVNAGSGVTGGTLKYKLSGGSYGTSVPTATDANPTTGYSVIWYIEGDANHNSTAETTISGITIAKANPSYTAPSKKSGLTYTGSAQALVNAATNVTSGCTVYYKLGDGSWQTSVPTASAANTSGYTVYWKITGNANYNDVAQQTISGITIAKATASLTCSNTAISFSSTEPTNTTKTKTGVSCSGGTINVQSANSDYVTASYNNGTITLTRKTNSAFSATNITVSVTPDANHSAPNSVTFSVSASGFDPGIAFDNVTTSHKGYYIARNGKAYSTMALANQFSTAVGYICYAGEVSNYFTKFIAIALTDAHTTFTNWSDALSKVNTFASNNSITVGSTTYNTNAPGTSSSYDAVATSTSTSTSSQTRTSGVIKGWRLPSVTDWRYIFHGLGNGTPSATSPAGISYGSAYGSGSTLRNAINTACGNTELRNNNYWSSSEDSRASNVWYYYFKDSYFGMGPKTSSNGVRAVFAY